MDGLELKKINFKEVKIENFQKRKINLKKYFKLLKLLVFILLLFILCILFLYFLIIEKFENEEIIKIKKLVSKLNQEQKNFCKNQNNLYTNQEYENYINLTYGSYLNNKFNLYVYGHKMKDGMSDVISKEHKYDIHETSEVKKALEKYAQNHKIKNKKDITFIDCGGNVGWYTNFFGNLGYNVYTFEALPYNYYVLRKNYCLRENPRITIFNYALFDKDEVCSAYFSTGMISNGLIFCEEEFYRSTFKLEKIGSANLTRFDNFVPYFKNKNVAVIKIDIEGSEGKLFKGGMGILDILKVPFIMIEFTQYLLQDHNTNHTEFIKMFYDYGYKISPNGFNKSAALNMKELLKEIGTYSYYNIYIFKEGYGY